MKRCQIFRFFLLITLCQFLTGCISNIWTGATLVYDRHNIYKKLSDYRLSATTSRALFKDDVLKCTECSIDLAVFNGDVLLSGHVPTEELRQEAKSRAAQVRGYRRIFNQLATNSKDTELQDNWITTKIRTGIFADSDIDPNSFKVVTSDQIVYLMGDVIPREAERVIQIARECAGVKRVVKLFKYYNLEDKPSAPITSSVGGGSP